MKKINIYIRFMEINLLNNHFLRLLTIFFLTLILNSAYSQKIEGSILDKKHRKLLEEKLDILNSHVNKCEFKVDDKRLTINFYENEEIYRIDYVYLETIDTNGIYFSQEENAVIMKCKSSDQLDGKLKKFKDGCIERHILKNNIIRSYYRISFQVSGNKDEFIKILQEIAAAAERNYE